MLYEQAVEIPERMTADGEILRDLDEATTRARLTAAYGEGYRSLAIVSCMATAIRTMNDAWRGSRGDRIFAYFRVHDVSPLMNLVDAATRPSPTLICRRFCSAISRAHGCPRRHAAYGHAIQRRSGGRAKVRARTRCCPAGRRRHRRDGNRAAAGFDRIIGFDMGGTSTDVCTWPATTSAPLIRLLPGAFAHAMMAVHTIAAVADRCLCSTVIASVWVRSPRAPILAHSYGKDGPLTVTDANVLLGRLQPAFFPRVFVPGRMPH